MTDYLDELELRNRRLRLMFHCQENMAPGLPSQGNASANQVGMVAGRTVKQIDSADSNDQRIQQIHYQSAKEDRLQPNYVNTIKQIYSSSPHKLKKGNASTAKPV